MAVDDIYTVSLLHFDGADESTTFTDESGKTWTQVGHAKIDSAQSKFGGTSGYFDGTDDCITTPYSADFWLDGGSDNNKWTIDFWVRFDGDPSGTQRGFIGQSLNQAVTDYWGLRINATDQLRLNCAVASTVQFDILETWNPADATWYHVAIVKDGTNGYMMFINGTQIGTTDIDTNSMGNTNTLTRIGAGGAGTLYWFKGWLDEFRVSKGIARWTTTFTPPTEPYTPLTFIPHCINII